MVKYFLAFYILLANLAFAQEEIFILEGTIDVDTGAILLKPLYNTNYYPGKAELSTKIKKGKFTFSGPYLYPAPYYLTIIWENKKDYTSGSFYLNKGVQKISCKTYSHVVTIKNEAMAELEAYDEILKPTEREMHQLSVAINGMGTDATALKIQDGIKKQRDSIQQVHNTLIIRYTREHPSSFISIWDVIPELNKGYSPFFDSFYAALSPQLQNSIAGKHLAEAIQKLRTVSIGSTFPQLTIYDPEDKKVVLSSLKANKLTLIDFWYSGCYPCIRLFPAYKKLYEDWHDKGFEIIAISTDEGERLKDWKRMIKEKELPWLQYLDKGKLNADKLYIERYPTSFLLDSDGKILRQDIRPDELEVFLKGNL